MEWVETTAKTVEEAKSLALDQLGVAEEDAEFEIVDEPRPGLFGRVRGEARVRARVRPTRPRPKVERRDRKRRGGSDSPAAEATPARSNSSRSRSRGAKDQVTDTEGAVVTAVESGEGSDEGSDEAKSTKSRSGQRRSQKRSTAGEKAMDTPNESRHDGPAPDAAAVGAAAVTFLEGLVDAFGLEGAVALHEVEDEMEVRVDGENLGLLVGPRGATLLAIQDITRVASQRRLGDHQTRLRIDIAGYREKRREALGRFAQKVAAEVVESGEERVLEAMPSADRKVIHDSLSSVDGVVTRSEGDDPKRYVVIAPA